MNKPILAISALALLASTAGAYIYYGQEKKTGRQHGVGVMKLSCDDSIIFSLRLKHQGKTLWSRTHDELFSMTEAVPTQDRRFQGKNIMPLAALLAKHETINSVTFTPCDGDSTELKMVDIKNSPELYYLGQNKRNRLKLIKYVGDRQYSTLKRNVIEINLNQ